MRSVYVGLSFSLRASATSAGLLEDAVDASALAAKLVALKEGELIYNHQEELQGVIAAVDT